MQNNHNDEDTSKQKYGVFVKHDGNNFTLLIPELGIINNHQDLNEGYKELRSAEEEYLQNLKDFGAQGFLPESKYPKWNTPQTQKLNINTSGLMLFTAKVAIIIMLFLGLGSVSAVVLGNIASKGFSRLINKVQASQPLNTILTNMETISPKTVEKHAQQVRRIGNKIQPVISELKLVWKSNTSPKAMFQKNLGVP